jgi:putative endonuclease
MKWFVYLARCADGSIYCGISNDVPARIETHNKGKGAKYTRARLPIELVWTEEHPDKIAAMQREYVVKNLTRIKKLEMINEKALS